MKKVIALVVTLLALAACGNPEASFDTVETNRATAKGNAEYNALNYRASSLSFSNFAVEVQGDSTQNPKCPQGDGWATAKMINKANPAETVKLKCSTVSGSIGCMTQKEFETKPYAADDGSCQPVSKVPFPIPKVAK